MVIGAPDLVANAFKAVSTSSVCRNVSALSFAGIVVIFRVFVNARFAKNSVKIAVLTSSVQRNADFLVIPVHNLVFGNACITLAPNSVVIFVIDHVVINLVQTICVVDILALDCAASHVLIYVEFVTRIRLIK